MSLSVDAFLARLKQRDPDQPEFHQAVEEVVRTLWPFLEANPRYRDAGILERMVEPERAIPVSYTHLTLPTTPYV